MKVLTHDDIFSVVTLYHNEICAITGTIAIYVLRGKALINGAPIIAPRTLSCPQIYGHVTTVSTLPAAYYGHVRENEKELSKLYKLLGERLTLLIERFAELCISFPEDTPVTAIFICVPIKAEIPIVYRAVTRVDNFGLHGVSLDDVIQKRKPFDALPPSVKLAVEWHASCKSISLAQTILVVGPQGVGKSAFSRLLANFKTGYHRYVILIDADCRNGESICPSMIHASVLQSGQKDDSDFPLIGSLFGYTIPYGYTSVSADPNTFIELIHALIRICTTYIQRQNADEETVPIVICTPVWYQGTMDTIIKCCVTHLNCDGIVEMTTNTSIQILAPTNNTLLLTQWDHTKRRKRENSLVFPKVYHYIVQGLQGLPGMDQFRTLRFLHAIIDFKKNGITPYGFKTLYNNMTGRDLICSAPFIEIISKTRPLQYIRITDIHILQVDEAHFSSEDILCKTIYPTANLSMSVSNGSDTITVSLSHSLYNIISKLPESRFIWAMHTIFSAMPVYLYSISHQYDNTNLLRFIGIGFLRNFNGLNPCIVSTLSSVDMSKVSVICLPHTSSFVFSSKIIRGNLEAFTTNQSMAKVIGYETYGGKGPNLLATERH